MSVNREPFLVIGVDPVEESPMKSMVNCATFDEALGWRETMIESGTCTDAWVYARVPVGNDRWAREAGL